MIGVCAWRKSFRDVLLNRKSYKEALMSNMLSAEAEAFHPRGFSDGDSLGSPTAEEAAELEACEDFVETMAHLDMLEHREEVTRVVRSELQKRWEARRELIGRPRKTARSLLHQTLHTSTKVDDASILVYHDHSKLEHRLRTRERSRMDKRRVQKKNAFMKARFMKPIQQPRRGRY